MKKLIAITILICLFAAFSGAFAEEEGRLALPIKQLFSEPSDDAFIVFEIPIEVALLEISEDANWYKVKISYGIGPFVYTYVGWAPIPVGDILSEREENCSEIASLYPLSK